MWGGARVIRPPSGRGDIRGRYQGCARKASRPLATIVRPAGRKARPSKLSGHAHGRVKAGELFAVELAGGVLGVEGLEADGVAGGDAVLDEDPLEGALVVGLDAGEAVHASFNGLGGAEDDDVALAVVREHGVADDAAGEGVGVGQVGAADVLGGGAGGVTEVGELARVAGGDFVDDGDLEGEEN